MASELCTSGCDAPAVIMIQSDHRPPFAVCLRCARNALDAPGLSQEGREILLDAIAQAEGVC